MLRVVPIVACMKRNSLHALPQSIGDLIRHLRDRYSEEAHAPFDWPPMSVRELSRRSGISAGQISRIENGETKQPSPKTLQALANGLVDPTLLLIVAGYLPEDDGVDYMEGLTISMGDARDSLDETVNRLFEDIGYADEVAEDPKKAAAYLSLRSQSLNLNVNWDADVNLDAPEKQAIREISAAWPALTQERKNLILALVSDQEVLSRLEVPKNQGRYRFDVKLESTRPKEGSDA